MPTFHIYNGEGRSIGVASYSNVYRYNGIQFEMHSRLGPTKLNKDMEPSRRTGDAFWKVFEEWDKLTQKEKNKTEINFSK